MANELPEHLKWIRSLPCCRCAKSAPSEPHHRIGGKGVGQRNHDNTAIPLCTECHRDFHALTGTFKGFTRAQLADFHDSKLMDLAGLPGLAKVLTAAAKEQVDEWDDVF